MGNRAINWDTAVRELLSGKGENYLQNEEVLKELDSCTLFYAFKHLKTIVDSKTEEIDFLYEDKTKLQARVNGLKDFEKIAGARFKTIERLNIEVHDLKAKLKETEHLLECKNRKVGEYPVQGNNDLNFILSNISDRNENLKDLEEIADLYNIKVNKDHIAGYKQALADLNDLLSDLISQNPDTQANTEKEQQKQQ